jgi:hypothetical protein
MANPIQPKLIKALNNNGWIAYSQNATGFGMTGLPDVIALKDGNAVFFEVKYGKDRISKIQEYRFNLLRNNGFKVIIVTNQNINDIIMEVNNGEKFL